VKLVLFDIDGTLVHAGGQAKPLFAEAVLEVFGTAGDIDGYDFSGKTDGRIVHDLLAGAGVPEATIRAGMESVRHGYLARMRERFDPARVRVLPGVVELLDALAARRDVAVGLLTGNWSGGARIKLGGVGLYDYFPFGGFGDDGLDRRELPPVALARAAAHFGRPFAAAATVIVGDSLLDVDCARANDIPCLAVATGWTAREALAAEGATWVVDDLSDVLAHPAFAAGALAAREP
jgi:phosphoglycolate phosphatase-like HAD superfamily hydrolase